MDSQVPWRCLVPADAVSFIIGRGGANIRQMSETSGADVAISKEGDTPETLADKIVTISGMVLQKESACAQIVRKLRQMQGVSDHEPGVFVIIVPQTSAPVIIGAKGAQIKSIMEMSGAEINVGRESIIGMPDQPISINGTVDQVISAVSKLNSVLQDMLDRGKLTKRDFMFRPQDPLASSALDEPPPRQPAATAPAPAPTYGGGQGGPAAPYPSGGFDSAGAGGGGGGGGYQASPAQPQPTPAPAPAAAGGFGGGGGGTSFGGAGTSSGASQGAQQPTSFGGGGGPGAQQPASFGGGSAQPTSFGGSNGQQTSFGGPNGGQQLTSFGGPSGGQQQTSFGGPNGGHQPTSFGGPNGGQQQTSFGGPNGGQQQTSFGGPSGMGGAPQQQTSFGGGQNGNSGAQQTSFGGMGGMMGGGGGMGTMYGGPMGMGGMGGMGMGGMGMGMGGMNPMMGGMGMGMGPMMGGMASPNERAFMQALQASGINNSELTLLLPQALIQNVLIPRGIMAESAQRSGAKIDLGAESPPGMRQVTLSGTMMANALASLILQEKVIQFQQMGMNVG